MGTLWIALRAHLRAPPFGLHLPAWVAPFGVALMPLGALLTLWSMTAFIVKGRGTPAPFAGLLLAAHPFVVFYEEPTLERRFGESYREYRRTTPRWFSRI